MKYRFAGLVIFFSLLVLFFSSILSPSLKGQNKRARGEIINVNHYANLRAKPKIRSRRMVKVPKGKEVEILQQGVVSQDRGYLKKKYPQWLKISYRGQVGYMAKKLVKIHPPLVNSNSRVISVKYDPKETFQAVSPKDLKERELLLTFDDGPRVGTTGKILDLLRKYKIQAVFFVNGHTIRYARKKGRSDLLARIHREGHLIANHTDRHRKLTTLKSTEREQEIIRCSQEIQKEFRSFGESWPSVFFRFPSAVYKHKSGLDLRKEVHDKYRFILIRPVRIHGLDWKKSQGSREILKKLKSTTKAQKKGIVMIHELPKSVRALEKYLPWALGEGYRFVSLKTGSSRPRPTSSGLPKVNVNYYVKKTKYNKIYYHWAKHYGLDWRLLKAIAIVESGEKAGAVNAFGYTGLFQIGKSVLGGFNKREKKNWTRPQMKDPGKNTRVGAWLTMRNLSVLKRPGVMGKKFLSHPAHLAVAVYCAHNYGIGLVKRRMTTYQKQKGPMTFSAVFGALEKAGKKRYGKVAGARKMEVAKKVAAIYLALRKKLPSRP